MKKKKKDTRLERAKREYERTRASFEPFVKKPVVADYSGRTVWEGSQHCLSSEDEN